MRFLIWATAVMGIASLGFLGWQIAREVNYALSYEDQVKETICEIVREDSLRERCDFESP